VIVRRDTMDSELREALAAISTGPGGLFDLDDLEGARKELRAFAEAVAANDDPSVSVETYEETQSAAPPVPIRLFRPRSGSGPLPALLWFHGGGQILGYAAQEDAYLKQLSRAVGCIVASVDYRLAPEAPSPAGAEDGYLAYRWLRDQADHLGISAGRIGLAGASGGGCIAAAAALMIRDRGDPTPLFQSLNYPMLDDRNTTPSSREITDIGIWDRETNIRAWRIILGEQAGGAVVSSYSAPARAKDLAGLPPTFIAVGELDVFRDEDMDYASRLVVSGVPTDFHLYSGAYHAFDVLAPDSERATSFRETWYGFLTREFR
jgi:acetyl esterase/lipase